MLPSFLFYNAIAHVYEAYCESTDINEFVEQEINLVQSYNPSSVLEFGIGNGRFAQEYLTRNPNVNYVGVDNAEEMLIHAKNSGAKLVLCDFRDYLKQIITEGKRFDCIIAPYTALHHISTKNQFELFENMKHVADVLIINCLTQTEEKIFGDSNETTVTINLAPDSSVSTEVYKIDPEIRKQTFSVAQGSHREFLVYTK